jgi:uncharacterized membrane-anchored protein
MDFKKLLLPLFALMVFAQLYVPAKMILDSENTIETGTIYKFNTVPVDPTDLFRGKYVQLRFRDVSISMPDTLSASRYEKGEKVFATFTPDEHGYAKPSAINRAPILNSDDYLEVLIRSVRGDVIRLSYPFDRFYMEESKAYPAEKLYRKVARDRSKSAYAVVSIKDGQAVLLDVEIDGVSIQTLVEEEQEGE